MKKEALLAKSALDKSNEGEVHMFPPQVTHILCLTTKKAGCGSHVEYILISLIWKALNKFIKN